jgi:hypothetical protein
MPPTKPTAPCRCTKRLLRNRQLASKREMIRPAIALLVLSLLFCPVSEAKILGVFQGKIIKTSATKAGKQWLYVQGKTGFVRKVDVAKAVVEYDDDFPVEARVAKPAQALTVSAEVRITAQQKKDVWLADEVLILAPNPSEKPKKSAVLRVPAKN